MRFKLSIVFVSLFSLVTLAFAADKAAANCVQQCESAKKSCLAQYTKEDSTSGRYVTPEGRSICYQAYHECKKNCPRK